MLRVGLVGIGKMGVSHLAILGAHPQLQIAGICDSQGYLMSMVRSQTEIETYKTHEKLLRRADLDCVVIATPTAMHVEAAEAAIESGVNVFVEKPLSLGALQSMRLSQNAVARGLANQVGYHNRFIGTFAEVRRLVHAGAIGEVQHVDGKAFGPVVTKQKTGFTWRSKKSEGGGCLHDYASHVIDLMNWIAGPPQAVAGARLQTIYSENVEDAVYALFTYANGATGQLEANWSDESYRKMSTSITVSGSLGKITADRQQCQIFLKPKQQFETYGEGWTIRNITELQPPVDYYLRGEEYSAQIDSFVTASASHDTNPLNSFASAYETDRVVEMIINSSEGK